MINKYDSAYLITFSQKSMVLKTKYLTEPLNYYGGGSTNIEAGI
jgi:hypothetical protein